MITKIKALTFEEESIFTRTFCNTMLVTEINHKTQTAEQTREAEVCRSRIDPQKVAITVPTSVELFAC